jgi:hypothetical protein
MLSYATGKSIGSRAYIALLSALESPFKRDEPQPNMANAACPAPHFYFCNYSVVVFVSQLNTWGEQTRPEVRGMLDPVIRIKKPPSTLFSTQTNNICSLALHRTRSHHSPSCLRASPFPPIFNRLISSSTIVVKMSTVLNGNIKPYLPKTKHPNGLRLLSLDGGGVKGISALMYLEEIMSRVQKKIKSDELCRPSDFFELAAGTSTGGIIALMLFRLRMTATDAIEMYDEISEKVFSPKVYGWDLSWMGSVVGSVIGKAKVVGHAPQFDDKHLKEQIDHVVARFGLDEEEKKKKGSALLARSEAARMYVKSTSHYTDECRIYLEYHLTFTGSCVQLPKIKLRQSCSARILTR